MSYWGLKKLVHQFEIIDYTKPILCDPAKYEADYMIKPGSVKQRIAAFLAKYVMWLVPGYIWLLKKPNP